MFDAFVQGHFAHMNIKVGCVSQTTSKTVAAAICKDYNIMVCVVKERAF